MSPYTIFVILLTTGCPYSVVSIHFTKPRPLNRYLGNYTVNVKTNPDSESINHYNVRSLHHDLYRPGNKRTGYTRHLRNEIDSYNSRMYRSYGRGKAEIPHLGATVSVLNAVTYPKVRKEAVTRGTVGGREESAQLVSRVKRKCPICPRNQKVIAIKGNTTVLLPEPCKYLKWYSLAGPEPGALLKEGHYTLIGRLGPRGKLCQIKYEVLVRRCGPLNVTSAHVNCTKEDIWGSKCTFTCDWTHHLEGPEIVECGHDQRWSQKPPICKKKTWCSYPQTPDNRKVSCQVPEEKEQFEDKLPRGTKCRYEIKGRQTILTCLDGYWVRMTSRKKKKGKKHGKVKRIWE